MFILAMAIIGIILAVLFVKYGLSESNKNQAIREIYNKYFNEKDLQVKEEINLTSDLSIKLYSLKYEDEDNQVLDKNELTYLRLARIINNPDEEYIKFNFIEGENEGEFDVDVELADFRLDEHKNAYIELIELVTNFNLAQFVFKNNKNEIDFKLLNVDLDVIDKMKQHTDDIISEIFPYIIEDISNRESSGILGQAFSKQFLE